MIDDACEEILQHEKKGHRRDLWFAGIIALVAIITIIALRLAADESQKGPSPKQVACEQSPWC
jgi:hypothetical protein